MSANASRLSAALQGRYTIEREIGAGGMATVYLAHDVRHDRKVALKVLKPELAAVVGADRFLAEIRTTANLQHPHILPLFDSGEADGFLYFVMPYVEGESLRGKLDREKQLPIDEAIRIATEVADALEHAHAKGVIHRDIKPANILLRDGRVQVADFGIALAVQQAGGARLTETGLSVGTPHYMSPEQASGDRALDGRSDVYSLGCVLYEMLAGEPPHTGPTAQSILSKILTEEPRPVRELRRTVPAHVEAAVHAALEKLPADRFANARGYATALTDPRSTPARIPAVARPSVTPTVSRLALVGVAAAGVAFGAILGSMVTRTEAPARPGLIFEAGTVTPREFGSSVAVSPDGSSVVYLSGPPDAAQLYHRRLATLDPIPIPGTAGAQSPFFSPNGEWVGYIRSRGIERVRLDGGTPEVVVPNPRVKGAGAGAVWAEDDAIYFFSDGLWRAPRRRGDIEQVVLNGVTALGWLGPLPKPNRFLASNWTFPPQIGVLDIESGEWAPLPGLSGLRPHYVEPGLIVYGREDGTVMAVRFDLREERVVGEPVPIATGVEVHNATPQFSVATNGVLAYVVDEGDALEIFELDGTTNPLTADRRNFNTPRFSPDGSRVVVPVREAGDYALWIYDMVHGTGERIAEGERAQGPVWSGDGSSLIYGSFGEGVMRRPAVRGARAEAVLSGTGSYYPLDRSPDGRIAFENWQGPEPTLLIDPRSAALDTLFPASPDVFSLRFDPLGDLIAFVTTETDRWEVHVRNIQDPLQRIQISHEGGVNPVWSPTGDFLYYVRWREDQPRGKLIRAEIRRAPALAVARETVVADWPGSGGAPEYGYDIHADGSVFVRVRRIPARRLIVVTEWTANLNDR